MKDLVIVGAGGMGREILQWVKDINKVNKTWEIKGFIDDDTDALLSFNCHYKVIGSIKDYIPNENEVFVCAIGHPRTKQQIVEMLKNKGAKFTSIVHPLAYIGDENVIGEGMIAYPRACVTTNVRIGDFVALLSSSVGHDAVIGDYTTISAYTDITGGCCLGERVFIGTHVSVIPGRTIGSDAYLCAGSVIMSDVKPGVKMLGNPAKAINF